MVQVDATIKLESVEKEVMTVPLEVAKVSKLIAGLIEGGDINEVIPL